jgi:hypothetical protein
MRTFMFDRAILSYSIDCLNNEWLLKEPSLRVLFLTGRSNLIIIKSFVVNVSERDCHVVRHSDSKFYRYCVIVNMLSAELLAMTL